MAFRDSVTVMYDGSVRITYKDGPHAYYKQERINYNLPEDDEKAWGAKDRPKGTTTLLGDTLEKKGLMTWPMGVALRELFGFYDFEPEEGRRLTGFSKGKGTFWQATPSADELLPLVLSASKAWQRRQKSGADIGTLVHDAIEQYITGSPIELTLEKYQSGQVFENDDEKIEWLKTAEAELNMAKIAYVRFCDWWMETNPTLISTEQVVYSKEFDISGAYDSLLEIDGRIIVEDHKTSNASASAGAPDGVYYSYFIQSAIYAICLLEMGVVERIDDLMIVSVRKDGGFAAIMASDVGLTMDEALDWAKAVIKCYRLMDKTKRGLIDYGSETVRV